MQRTIKTYLVFSNIVAAILLIVIFEPLSETVEVVNEKAVPMLKQLQEPTDQQPQAANDQRHHDDNEQALAYLDRMLAKAQTRAARIKIELRVIAAWLLANAIVLWWRIGRVDGAAATKPATAPN